MFCATNKANNSDKSKWVYVCYGIPFDILGLWSFGNGFASNVTILMLIIVHKNMWIIIKIRF